MKLEQVRLADPARKAFGAATHRYLVGPPLTEREIAVFEKAHGVSLPGCFRAFLTLVGNGGASGHRYAAGPDHGIYPLDCDDRVIRLESLRYPCQIAPNTSLDGEAWAAMWKLSRDAGPICREEDERQDRIYGGILEIGTQGCSSVNAIIVRGERAGRVVGMDWENRGRPYFYGPPNFLDWYEGWLDRILSR